LTREPCASGSFLFLLLFTIFIRFYFSTVLTNTQCRGKLVNRYKAEDKTQIQEVVILKEEKRLADIFSKVSDSKRRYRDRKAMENERARQEKEQEEIRRQNEKKPIEERYLELGRKALEEAKSAEPNREGGRPL